MTTEDQYAKAIPALYIFARDENGQSIRMGTAWYHQTGNGINIVINGQRFVAFPPKFLRPATPEPGKGA
jgi:hypothetical protein